MLTEHLRVRPYCNICAFTGFKYSNIFVNHGKDVYPESSDFKKVCTTSRDKHSFVGIINIDYSCNTDLQVPVVNPHIHNLMVNVVYTFDSDLTKC